MEDQTTHPTKKRARLQKRNAAIREYYQEQWKQGYRNDKIIAELEEMYHLAPLTLEYIVFRRSGYEEY